MKQERLLLRTITSCTEIQLYFYVKTVYACNMNIPATISAENICKFEYEYLGRSLEEISRQYNFPVATLEYSARLNGWQRKVEGPLLPAQGTTLENFAEELEKLTRARLSIISLHKQIENQPLYAELERAILKKALEVAQSLDANDTRSANALASVAKTLTTVQERNPINLAEQFAELTKNASGGITVQIANIVN